MKRRIITQTLAILGLAFCGLRCDELITPGSETTGEVVYFTSFEKDADTSGWQGYEYGFRNEAPPKGGNRSLFVSGGCIVPHGLLNLKPLDHDSRLIIQCWGKNLGIGGGVSLGVDDGFRKKIHISVQNQEWTAYESSDTLFCPAGSKLSLSVGAGGIVSSAMLVDLIEIRRVQ